LFEETFCFLCTLPFFNRANASTLVIQKGRKSLRKRSKCNRTPTMASFLVIESIKTKHGAWVVRFFLGLVDYLRFFRYSSAPFYGSNPTGSAL